MPNIPDQIRIKAFEYVHQNNTTALSQLIDANPSLVNERSKRDESTLLIRAGKYLHKDIIELLLNKGADPLAYNFHGNNIIMSLFYRDAPIISDPKKHDYEALKILELFKEKNIPIACFVAQDRDGDTPLIEAGRARLLECSKFIVEILKKHQLLEKQWSHVNHNGQNIIQIVDSLELLEKMLHEKPKIFSPFELAQFHIYDAIRIDSPTSQQKAKLLCLVKEELLKLSSEQIENLARTIFQKKLYDEDIGTDSTYHTAHLQRELASGNFGVKIFNSIDVELIELLYVAGGMNLNKHMNFINSLSSLQDTEINKNGICGAVILESNKQKMLQIIKGSNIFSPLAKEHALQDAKDEDTPYIKDLALKRFCFLVANKENLEINEKSEAGMLLTFVTIGNDLQELNNDISHSFKKYLLKECGTYKNFKKVLDSYGNKITEMGELEHKLVSKLSESVRHFEDNTALLTSDIELFLNKNLTKKVLPHKIFLSLSNSTTEVNIDKHDQELIQNNLKFFTAPSTFKVPEYDTLDQAVFKNSIEYYKNNQDALIPNLVLLKTINDEVKLSKIKDILKSNYMEAKSTVGNCLNVILKYHECYKSLETINLSTDGIKQDLLDKLPGLTDKIEIVLNSPEVENVKNITLLCKEVQYFLNISPITSVFEEYDNNYQALKYDIDKAEEILGEIGIEF